ncbi:MAG: hypothetical protein ACOC1K_01220 [Nanoarchaeota archaeon]
MGFRYSFFEEDLLDIKGFGCEKDLKAKIELKELIRLINEVKKEVKQGYEFDAEEFSERIFEIIRTPDENGEYEY